MEELKKLFSEVGEDAIEMTEYTMKMCPTITLEECFPYSAYRTVCINEKDYRVKVEIQLSEMK